MLSVEEFADRMTAALRRAQQRAAAAAVQHEFAEIQREHQALWDKREARWERSAAKQEQGRRAFEAANERYARQPLQPGIHFGGRRPVVVNDLAARQLAVLGITNEDLSSALARRV